MLTNIQKQLIQSYKNQATRIKMTDAWRYIAPTTKEDKSPNLEPRTKFQKLILSIRHRLVKAIAADKAKQFCIELAKDMNTEWSLDIDKEGMDTLFALL